MIPKAKLDSLMEGRKQSAESIDRKIAEFREERMKQFVEECLEPDIKRKKEELEQKHFKAFKISEQTYSVINAFYESPDLVDSKVRLEDVLSSLQQSPAVIASLGLKLIPLSGVERDYRAIVLKDTYEQLEKEADEKGLRSTSKTIFILEGLPQMLLF